MAAQLPLQVRAEDAMGRSGLAPVDDRPAEALPVCGIVEAEGEGLAVAVNQRLDAPGEHVEDGGEAEQRGRRERSMMPEVEAPLVEALERREGALVRRRDQEDGADVRTL